MFCQLMVVSGSCVATIRFQHVQDRSHAAPKCAHPNCYEFCVLNCDTSILHACFVNTGSVRPHFGR